MCGRLRLCALVVAGLGLVLPPPAHPAWRSLGPDAGAVISLAVDPHDPSTIYAGAEAGRVFKSTDGGATWRGGAGFPFSFVGGTTGPLAAIAIDPTTPSILYAAASGDLLKSTDAGEHWSRLAAPLGTNYSALVNAGLSWPVVFAVAVTRSGSPTVYAGVAAAAVFGRAAVAAGYDEEGTTEVAVYRSTTGVWLIRAPVDGSLTVVPWGGPPFGDVPVPADYEGSGRSAIAVYRTTTAEWFIRRTADGGLMYVAWGSPVLTDTPAPADYDGDGRADIAVYRRTTGEWFVRRSTDLGLLQVAWGSPFLDDVPAPADYDANGRIDTAVYRRSTGEWFVRRADGSVLRIAWGAPALGDVPVPAP